MRILNSIAAVSVGLFLLLSSPCLSICYAEQFDAYSNSSARCKASERETLLLFKQGFNDPAGMLSSWTGTDCCNWTGVACDEVTGNIIKLDLSSFQLQGTVPRQLGELTNLLTLDLSGNVLVFDKGFRFSNLTALEHLHLASYYFRAPVCIIGSNEWISRLTHLRYLDLSGCELEDNATHILQALTFLPHISEVYLRNCIHNMPLPPSLQGNQTFTSLSVLSMPRNRFNYTIPKWLGNITTLQTVDIAGNSMKGSISTILGNLCQLVTLDASQNEFTDKFTGSITNLSYCDSCELESLDMSFNRLTGPLPIWLTKCRKLISLEMSRNALYGPIPEFLGTLTSLEELRLFGNNLTGNFPSSTISQLTRLIYLDVGNNQLQGTLSELHLSNLSQLLSLDLSSNSLELNVSDSWVPSFGLEVLNLGSCITGSHFPLWLRTQDKLDHLYLDNTGISGILPEWIWNFSSKLTIINLSNNRLGGNIPDQLLLDSFLANVNLSSNKFEGSLPRFFSQNLNYLDLSNNSFSGQLSEIKAWPVLPDMYLLSLSSNKFNGSVPSSVCTWGTLSFLDISINYLVGPVPSCLKRMIVLNVAGNFISGNGFTSTSSPCNLKSLHLNNNRLSGTLPLLSLQNCSSLTILDLGENRITGPIPDELAEFLPNVKVLRLHDNLISGGIPSSLPRMSSLQVIDLGNNLISGNIPKSFGNFSSMKYSHNIGEIILENSFAFHAAGFSFADFVMLIIKQQRMVFNHLLSLVTSIDLSNNMLSSEIPAELGNLIGLVNLNLSGNFLTGRIPEEFYKLQKLESLDLSKNKLSGEIPTILSRMTSLSHLNLSFNNLSGSIPNGYQFSTFINRTIYMGNPYLCGFPLDKCEHDKNKATTAGEKEGYHIKNRKKDDSYETKWLMAGMLFGFIVGFWIFHGTLILNTSWRYAYYGLIHKKCVGYIR